MKRIISLFLTVTMITSLIVAIPVTNVAAAETITDEALFMTYPTYLSNSEMDEGLAKAEAAYYAVINSYSKSDQAVAALMTSMSEGISLFVKDELGKLGFGESYYEENAKKAATKYMQSMLSDENIIRKATNEINKAYKTLKTSYKVGSAINKTKLLSDLRKLAEDNDLHISVNAMDDMVDQLYDAGTLKEDLDAIGEANELWKYVLEFTEIHAIEMATMDLLIDELVSSGQTESDLYLGLTLLKEEIELNQAEYVLKKYSNSKVISYLAKHIEEEFFSMAEGSTVTVLVVTTFCKVFADYVYVNAKADDIIQATMQTSFVNSIDICLSKYRLKFLQGKGTTTDIETYKNLYAATISARIAVLDTCYDVAKITDKFSLGGDCLVWKDLLEYNYTYDNYIKWCKEAVAHDIANAELDKTTGESTITDALNEETIKARLDKIRAISLYKPNAGNTFRDAYQTEGTLGFAALVFNRIFDREMGTRVENRYNHILTNNKNVRVVGRLEESDVTVSALKELFANVRIGDVLLTSGQYDYLHAMVVISVEDDGVIVYDCDSKYTPDASKDMERFEIREYKISYEKMADAFSENGVYMSVSGISVYRAINKVNSTNSGSNLYYEEYDDSINYVIEDGVLKGYTGLRTTLEIPEGVTKIAEDCFGQNQKIKHVIMPDTVVEIGRGAFQNCQNLQTVKFSANLKEIYAVAFANCKSLYNIALPNGLYAIYSSVFYGSGLNSIVIPDSVEIIEWYAFENCTNLRTITIGEKVRRFYSSAMRGCVNLETVYWNSSDKGVYNQFGDAFGDAGKENGGFTVIVGSNVTSIPDKAFYNADYLKRVVIPEGVSRIGKEAFWGCQNFTHVNLPDSLVRIEGSAFSQCDLRTITIPEKVSYIGDWTFSGCDNLETVYWNAVELSNSSWMRIFSTGGSLYKNMKVVFGDTVKSIPNYILEGCSQVTEIIIGENVKKIGERAFSQCNVSELIIPDSVTTIGAGAIHGLHNLTDLIIPDSVTNMEWGAIQWCNNLTNLTLPLYANDNMLNGILLSNLQNIYISPSNNNFESIDGVLYKKNTKRTLAMVPHGRDTITILKDCKEIGWSAFYNNEEQAYLQEIKVEKGNTSFAAIDGNLYSYNGKELIKYAEAKRGSTFNVPQNVTTIKRAAFYGANGLSEVTIPNSVQNIESSTFAYCKNIKKVTLPEGITAISDLMFSISGISDITIPDTVTEIGDFAFQKCENLNHINIPSNVNTISQGSFALCSNLKDVYYDGTESDWKKISIAEGNDYLLNATIHYAASNDENADSGELLEYAYEIPAGFNSYDEIYVPCYYVGDKVYSQVRSKNYSETNALMDIETGELVLDNVSGILSVSAYSDLICYTTSSEEIFIYDLEKRSEICELAGLGSIGYYGHFSEEGGFVLLKSDGKMHFMTNEGMIGNAVDIDYSSYGDENNHVLVWGYKGEGWYQLGVGNHYMGIRDTIGLVNSNGEVIFGVSAENFRDGFAIAEKAGKYGVIDAEGNFVIPNEYEDISYSSSAKTYVATKDSTYYELNASGDVISTFVPDFDLYDEVDSYLGNGFAKVYNKTGTYSEWKYGIVNENNEIIIPIAYANLYAWDGFVENMCCVHLSETYMGETLYGYLDENGTIVIPFEYEYANNFSEGLAAVCKDDKYGFIDKEGNVVIPFEYEYANDFSEGLAAVCKDDKYGFVDKEGNVVIPFEYADATSFSDGLAYVWYNYDMDPVQINKNNEVVPSTESTPAHKYSLTEGLDLENNTYTGGIKNNETGEVADISHLNLLPCVLGENGQFVIGFTSDFTKAYRILIDDMFDTVPKTEIKTIEVDSNGMQAEVKIQVMNAPTNAVVYVASYDRFDRMLELKQLTLDNGIDKETFSVIGVSKYKAFVWESNLMPLANSKEYVVQ